MSAVWLLRRSTNTNLGVCNGGGGIHKRDYEHKPRKLVLPYRGLAPDAEVTRESTETPVSHMALPGWSGREPSGQVVALHYFPQGPETAVLNEGQYTQRLRVEAWYEDQGMYRWYIHRARAHASVLAVYRSVLVIAHIPTIAYTRPSHIVLKYMVAVLAPSTTCIKIYGRSGRTVLSPSSSPFT